MKRGYSYYSNKVEKIKKQEQLRENIVKKHLTWWKSVYMVVFVITIFMIISYGDNFKWNEWFFWLFTAIWIGCSLINEKLLVWQLSKGAGFGV